MSKAVPARAERNRGAAWPGFSRLGERTGGDPPHRLPSQLHLNVVPAEAGTHRQLPNPDIQYGPQLALGWRLL